MSRKSNRAKIIGLGLDNKDGHIRVTRSTIFDLYGGSEETHARMQESCIKFTERLDQRHKRLEELPSTELHDLAAQCDLAPLLEFRREKKPEAND